MKKPLSGLLLSVVLIPCLTTQTSISFELRYYMPDSKANSETDFKGETAVSAAWRR